MTAMDEQAPPTTPEPATRTRAARPARPAQTGVSRRTVVLGAGAAAGGLAITRILGLHKLGPDPFGLVQPAVPTPTVNTKDWLSPLDQPEAQVAQLLRRTTFGMTRAQYDVALKDGFKTTVDKLVETLKRRGRTMLPPANAGLTVAMHCPLTW